jgi:hypothetical protein
MAAAEVMPSIADERPATSKSPTPMSPVGGPIGEAATFLSFFDLLFFF